MMNQSTRKQVVGQQWAPMDNVFGISSCGIDQQLMHLHNNSKTADIYAQGDVINTLLNHFLATLKLSQAIVVNQF